jgi:DNA-binding NtrC family response regulator
LIERLVVLTRDQALGVEHLPEKMLLRPALSEAAGAATVAAVAADETTLEGAMHSLKRRMLVGALHAYGVTRAAAATRLHISRSYLHRLIGELGIN